MSTVQFVDEVCIVCGVHFGLDSVYLKLLMNHTGGIYDCKGKNNFIDDDDDDDPADHWKRNGKTEDGGEGNGEKEKKEGKGGFFCCPNGHVQHYLNADDETKEIKALKEELARLKGVNEKLEADLATKKKRTRKPVPEDEKETTKQRTAAKS